MPHPNPTPSPPAWPHCAHSAATTDPVGCRGIHVPGHTTCLAHLTDADRDTYLAGLAPGADVDHRGTTFTEPLLDSLLAHLRAPATGNPSFGDATFESATFTGNAEFVSATFMGNASFGSATFMGNASFGSATFMGNASFRSATVTGYAWFRSATFEYRADFRAVTFTGDARFESVTFTGDARFESATFTDSARFSSATFAGNAGFRSTAFESSAVFASATFEKEARFSFATFKNYSMFTSAVFAGDAMFGSAVFGDDARFSLATFKNYSMFTSAVFAGDAMFGSAVFGDDARFSLATFKNYSMFTSAVFKRSAEFSAATFERYAGFDKATFESYAGFDLAAFRDKAYFLAATFKNEARFWAATFESKARFDSATFEGRAQFDAATFKGDARFESARFEKAAVVGALVCAGQVILSGAVFGGPVTLQIAAHHLECRRTRWSATAELRLRYATVDLTQAVFEYPLTIAAESSPFILTDGKPLAEDALAGAPEAAVRLASVRGVDAAHLVLSDIDLSRCLFTGTVHLDQLRLEGTCSFDTAPSTTAWRHGHPVRFTQRSTLAEEHHWRAGQPAPLPGWNTAVLNAGHVGPAQLAPVYRALRKSYEDSKNEPGAADFYYGEMEMRRHNRARTTRTERGLLHGYWLLSGYGLRASRALGWLAAAMLTTVVLLMGFGLPQDDPKQEATGTVPPGGGQVTLEIDKNDPQNPTTDRFSGQRFDKALIVTLNSVVFRSSGQDLTTSGTYIEMASRVTEPILLGLAVLAVRNRVKR
ncbi:pentapeptide repeat-containing protein (plasmid) [Streptomyces sp. NBC_01220]|uniref:pentapeptide repeat-containing protein n=1 Tax=Streptomyces sp. NBC_01220 TaxID=2903781 RepID=UPI002F91A820|nr:pentapeptide repeat-containing protein [Streptomyces sp. NBC_01220]